MARLAFAAPLRQSAPRQSAYLALRRWELGLSAYLALRRWELGLSAYLALCRGAGFVGVSGAVPE